MTRLDVADGFDVHDYRHGLKLRRQDGEAMVLENRDGFECPACGKPFELLFVAEASTVSFDSPPNGPICLVNADEQLLVLTH